MSLAFHSTKLNLMLFSGAFLHGQKSDVAAHIC